MNFFIKIKDFFGNIVSFYRKNSSHITHQVVNQFGLIIFSLAIMLTVNVMPADLQDSMAVVASVFSIAFYMFLIFYAMRENGNKDSVRIESGRLSYDKLYGLKVGFAASVPNYFFALLMLIGLLFSGDLFAVAITVSNYVLMPMYSGALTSLLRLIPEASRAVVATVAFFIVPVLAPLASYIGYNYGCRHPHKEKQK